MTRRDAYAAFEKTILNLYEQKILSADLLDRVARHYRLAGADSAGSQYVRTRDGKDLQQVCIELIDPIFPISARGSNEDHDEAWELELKKWEEIVQKRWGWQTYDTTFTFQERQDSAA